MAAAYSIGISDVKIDSNSLGSITSASIDIEAANIPLHSDKVGQAMLVGKEFITKSFHGTLNVTTEEFGLTSSLFTEMAKVIKGDTPGLKSFSCKLPYAGASLSGNVYIIPQFSTSGGIDQFGTITLRLPIIGDLTASAGSMSNQNTIGGVPFLPFSADSMAITSNPDNLCLAVSAGGFNAVGAKVDGSCQYKPIYRSGSLWPKDIVIDSVKILAEIDIADFTSLQAINMQKTSFDVEFKSIGGSNLKLNLGDSCVKYLAGYSSTGNVNTWKLKVEGNSV